MAQAEGGARPGIATQDQPEQVVVDLAPLAGKGGLEVDGAHLSAAGIDRAEFLIAPNKGEKARPLAKIASGGELSRAMLAIKRVLAGLGRTGTYVFDEVDTGVGGVFSYSSLLQVVVLAHSVFACARQGSSSYCAGKSHCLHGRHLTSLAPKHGSSWYWPSPHVPHRSHMRLLVRVHGCVSYSTSSEHERHPLHVVSFCCVHGARVKRPSAHCSHASHRRFVVAVGGTASYVPLTVGEQTASGEHLHMIWGRGGGVEDGEEGVGGYVRESVGVGVRVCVSHLVCFLAPSTCITLTGIHTPSVSGDGARHRLIFIRAARVAQRAVSIAGGSGACKQIFASNALAHLSAPAQRERGGGCVCVKHNLKCRQQGSQTVQAQQKEEKDGKRTLCLTSLLVRWIQIPLHYTRAALRILQPGMWGVNQKGWEVK